MKCFNPFCPKLGYIYKTRRGLDQHLSMNKDCMTYMKQLTLNQPRSLIGYKHTFFDILSDSKPNDNLNIKRHCTDVTTFIENINDKSLNNISHELETMLDDNFDTNSFSSIQSSRSIQSSNLNEPDKDFTEATLGNIFTKEQKSIIKLMKLLDDMNSPDYAMYQILSWARSAYIEGFTFNLNTKTRNSNLNWMKQMVVNNNAFYPKPITVNLNDNLSIDVMCFDFPNQLLHLLQNKKLMTQENLLIDVNNPTNAYKSPNNILSEALSGSAYKTVFQNAHENHTGYLPLLVVLICLWGDATHIDTSGRFKLELWSFSPLIFKE